MTPLKVLHHGHCFDGVVSAALMVRLLRALDAVGPGDPVTFQGLTHRLGPVYDSQSFDAAINAIVDFRYCADSRVTWWFDHHGSTFDSASDRAHFEADATGRRFFDPLAPSCAGLLVRTAQERFDVDIAPTDPDLVAWADRIDSAGFDSAEQAVSLASPPLRFMLWLETAADEPTQAAAATALAAATPLESILEWPDVAGPLDTALAEHLRLTALVAKRMTVSHRVAWIDLSDQVLSGINKFIPYAENPGLLYSVALLNLGTRIKVSVGRNPWARVAAGEPAAQDRPDIGALCQEFGGGGHPAVGAVSLPPDAAARGREIAHTLVAKLASTHRDME